jgi:Arc/MetJ-type ribon-helix-helix transcriptional regulator
MAKTREITVTIPEYLYEASVRMTALGLFRDLSDLVGAGLRHELREAQRLLELEPQNWQSSSDKLRAQIQQKQMEMNQAELSEAELLNQLRTIRQEVWANDYQTYYAFDA